MSARDKIAELLADQLRDATARLDEQRKMTDEAEARVDRVRNRAEKAERERDEAREALARVEALADELEAAEVADLRDHHAGDIRAALRGDDA